MTPSGIPDASAVAHGLMSAADFSALAAVVASDMTIGGKKSFTDGIRVGAVGFGTLTNVALGAIGDENTGLRFPAADTIDFITAGVLRAQIASTGQAYFTGIVNADAGLTVSGYPNSKITSDGSRVDLGNGGTLPARALYLVGSASSTAFYASANGGFSAAAGLRLWSETLGGTAGDVVAKIGAYIPSGSINAAAKLLSVRVGLGGTEVDKFYVSGNGSITINGNANTTLSDVGNAFGTGVVISTSSYFSSTSTSTAFYAAASGGYSAQSTLRLWSEQQGNASGEVAARVGYFSTGTVADAKILAFAENLLGTATDFSAIMGNGEFEHFVNGAGIVLKSPNGTRYRLTVTNAGALTIAAA